MARFDVYAHPDPQERKQIPYLLDVQNSYLDLIDTKVVIPLYKSGYLARPIKDLNPTLNIQGTDVILNTAELSAIPAKMLRKPLTNAAADQVAIQTALDSLLGSY